jgi:transposase
MRGNDEQQGAVFRYVGAEQRIAAEHPLRRIRAMTDAGLRELSGAFDALYAAGGRPSIAPERRLRALLLQVLYSRRSERLLMEEMNYNLLFRWFVGLEMDDEVWDVTVFTKNRERLIAGEVAQKFFAAVLKQARSAGLLSDEPFYGGWNADRGLGQPAQFREEAGSAAAGDGSARTKVAARHARVENGPGGAAVPAKPGGGIAAELSGTRDHREPERVGGGGVCDAVQHQGRAGGGVGDAGTSQRRNPEDHAGSGQGVSGTSPGYGRGRWCRMWPSTR